VTAELVRILNERCDCGLVITGVTDEGQSGAAYVRWPDGRDSVVTTAFGSLDRMRRTADVLADVRSLGIPVPRHEFLLDLGDGTVAVVQQRLPGSTRPTADPNQIGIAQFEAIVELNERFAGLLADRPAIEPPRLSFGREGDPTPIDLVEQHSRRARALLDAIRGAAGDLGAEVGGDDLVHTDLTVANTLFDADGRITGLIDWNYGVSRGDRHYGLAKLLHNFQYAHLTSPTGSPGLVAEAERIVVDQLGEERLRRYWASITLTMMDVSLRWGTEQAFQTCLAMGEARISRKRAR
jgi:aminoglycoside phosphotransferase (APT) family kinase protein